MRRIPSAFGIAGSLLFAFAAQRTVAQGTPTAGSLVHARLEIGSGAPAAAIAASASSRWIAWTVPVVGGQGDVCCYHGSGPGGWGRRGCTLGKNGGINISGDVNPVAGQEPELLVLVRAEHGTLQEARAFSSTCPVDADGAAVLLLEVAAEDSVRTLAALAGGAPKDGIVAALALHAAPAADAALERLASRPGEAREDAIFWLGQARRQAGVLALRRLLAARPDRDAREKIAFALAQSPEPEALADLLAMSRQDPDPETRGEALFWLAQHGGPEAESALVAATASAEPDEVRKKAVFGLSQLEHGRGTPLLLRVLRENRNPEIRREALFWLGQSDDPKAQEALEALLLH